MIQARPRLELLSRAGWDRHTPNLLRAIAHHPDLLEPFLGFAAGPGAPGWSDADRALLVAADELHAQKAITDATWAALAAHWNSAQLVEIAFVVGQYTMLSMVAGALRVPLGEGLPRLPRGSGADVS